MSKVVFSQSTTPSVPPAGTLVLYAKNDGHLYALDPAGVDTRLDYAFGSMALQNSGSVSITGGAITGSNIVDWGAVDKLGSDILDIVNKQHSHLDDDQPEKHRLINDAGTSTTTLWSSQKISDVISSISGGYLVGKDPGDPYSEISTAIEAAVLAGHDWDNPVVIQVKPGVYTGDVIIQEGINVIALAFGKSYMTRLNGTLTVDATAGGTVGNRIASWIGIDIVHDSLIYSDTLRFVGTNPQRLNIWNCEINNANGAAAACIMTNTGTGSLIAASNVNFNNTSSGKAIDVVEGKLSLFQTQTNSYTGTVAVAFAGTSQVESFFNYATGQWVFNGNTGGLTSNAVFNSGSNPAIVKNSTTVLLAVLPYKLSSGALLGGTNPETVTLYPSAASAGEEALDYYEGNNPPDIGLYDVYGFQDAAAFYGGVDQDVILKIDNKFSQYDTGAQLILLYAMSSAEVSKSVRLKLDYVVHASGEDFDAGIPYAQTITLPVPSTAKTLSVTQLLAIPNGHITSSTVEVECRLSRLGSDPLDTHSGDFGLKGVIIVPQI